jgi:superfamily II DNA or RNA helicase
MYTPQKNIIDNNEIKLFNELNNILTEQKNLDVASGFFNIGGFALVKDNLKSTNKFRLLLGKTPSIEDQNNHGNLFNEFSNRVKNEMESEEFNAKNDSVTDELINFLKRDNVEVKLYKDSFLHGKAYIFDDISIIGSSNFTFSGLGGNSSRGFNTELNSVKHHIETQYLKKEWFENLWNLESNKDFKEKLIEILEESKFGNKTTPYEVYMKALFELEKESIEYRLERDFDNDDSRVDLTEFQQDAVKRVYSRLNRYNGVMIADSVGLGKTWIAKKVIEEYGIFDRKGFMVVCPAQLRDNMWIPELKELGVSNYIVSQESLSNHVDNIDWLINHNINRKPENIELIVIDESHNFRNPLSNRWEALFTLIEKCTTEGNIPKLLLLTATPINNSIWDLYHQIMLITRNDPTAFMKDNIPDLKDYFRDIDKNNETSQLDNLLNQIAIRRTRQYIQSEYPEAKIGGKDITFPERKLKQLDYNLDETYKGLYQEIANKIENDLNMAYYNLEADYKYEAIDDLQAGRMKGLSGIFKTILLKRLESSVEAFRISVSRQINFLKLFKELFFEKELLFTKTFFNKYVSKENDSINDFDVSDYKNIDRIISDDDDLEKIDLKNYDVNNLEKDLDKDIAIFTEMYNETEMIFPEEDAKLNRLKEKLLDLKKDNSKIVLFSYFTDTLNYIYKEILKDKTYMNKLNLNIKKIDGGVSPSRREKIVSDFMNDTKNLEGKNIDVIFSTDVLSEGQNLQQAKFLINYDLHWNPTRMIQRAGRIDRLGSDFDEIKIYNFFPEDELESLLKLVGNLQNKIEDINNSIGLDASVLGEKINPKVFGTLKIMKEGTEEQKEQLLNDLENEKFGGSERFWLPLKEFIDNNAINQLQELPDGIKSGLEKKGIKGVFYSFRYLTDNKFKDYHYWLLYDLINKKWITNKSKIINYIQCKEDTDRFFNKNIDIYSLYDEAVNQIKESFSIVQDVSTFQDSRSEKFLRELTDELFYFRGEYEFKYEDPETVRELDILLDKIDKINFTKKRLKDIRKIWRQYINKEIESTEELIKILIAYFKEKKILDFKERKEFKKDNLKLICIDVIN